MNSLTWYEYVLVGVGTTIVTLVLTPLALRVALHFQILDHPGATKSQTEPVAYLGGLAIVVAFSFVVIISALIHPAAGGVTVLAVLLGTGLCLAVLGLIDDIRGLGVTVRLMVECACAIVVWGFGTRVQLLSGHVVGGKVFDAVFTIVWVVGLTNAFNMLDNMDGLSAGIAGIAALGLFVVALRNGQFLVATLSLALAGCAAGFLRHNFHPARIYMGDSGSLFLGFLLAVLCLRLRTHSVERLSFVIPVLILGVALFDSSLVVCCRLRHHRNPFAGGRDHTSHRLVKIGFSVRSTVAIIYVAGVALGWLAIAIYRIDRATTFAIGGLVLAIGVFMGYLLACVPVYGDEASRGWLTSDETAPASDPHRPGERSQHQPNESSVAHRSSGLIRRLVRIK